ncbi:MAG: endonuclease/exonuclease/phosphatase family protein [Brucellaceae bacterium]|nr:endonuclease/exonuclease/phosphatase family protein [Brucellaceae bacterium]
MRQPPRHRRRGDPVAPALGDWTCAALHGRRLRGAGHGRSRRNRRRHRGDPSAVALAARAGRPDRAVGAGVRRPRRSAVIAGDFNAAPWSAAMRSIADASGATVSPGATWLGFGLPQALRPLAGLPIDHVLVKGAAPLEKPWRLGDAGSDHLPVMLRFAVPAAAGDDRELRMVATVMLDDGASDGAPAIIVPESAKGSDQNRGEYDRPNTAGAHGVDSCRCCSAAHAARADGTPRPVAPGDHGRDLAAASCMVLGRRRTASARGAAPRAQSAAAQRLVADPCFFVKAHRGFIDVAPPAQDARGGGAHARECGARCRSLCDQGSRATASGGSQQIECDSNHQVTGKRTSTLRDGPKCRTGCRQFRPRLPCPQGDDERG